MRNRLLAATLVVASTVLLSAGPTQADHGEKRGYGVIAADSDSAVVGYTRQRVT